MNYPWNWLIFMQQSPDGGGRYIDLLISGLGWTLAVALSAWGLALVLGAFIGVLRTVPHRAASRFATALVDLFRNVPLLVQIFLWYFVVPEILPKDLGT